MKLNDIVKHMNNEESLMSFVGNYFPQVDYYDAEVFCIGELDSEAEVLILNGEECGDQIEISHLGKFCIHLFSLDDLLEHVNDFMRLGFKGDSIIDRIISYRINDAQ